jgi:hypothetical protein
MSHLVGIARRHEETDAALLQTQNVDGRPRRNYRQAND